MATKLPEEYVKISNSFLRFIRRVSNRGRSQHVSRIIEITSPSKRFPRSRILNLDETPIPFEYLDGYTYNSCGSRTVAGRSSRSGWDKRQATLILYIFADGVTRLKPNIIFHGAEKSRILADEIDLYAPDVTVSFNPTAYNNEDLLLRWISEELDPILQQKEHLLVMDVAAFHKTEAVLTALRERRVITALIPPGCTSLLQPLDTAVNAAFKVWLREATDEYLEKFDPDFTKVWSTSERRVMTTWVVSKAAAKLASRPDLVKKAFVECGISISPNGSEDNLVKIKDIKPEDIDFSGWENAADPVVKFEHIVDQFRDEEEYGLADDSSYLALLSLRKADLIELCRLRGLPVSGNKGDLAQHIIQNYNLSSSSITQ